MSTSNRSPRKKTVSNSSQEQSEKAGTDGETKPNPVKVYRDKLAEQLQIEDLQPLTKKAFEFEFIFMKGYLSALPKGDDFEFLHGFLTMLYLSGRSVMTIEG